MEHLINVLKPAVLIGVFLYTFVLIPLKLRRNLRGIPSPPTLPILGNVIGMWNAQYEFNKVVERWGGAYGSRLVLWCTSWFPIVVLGNAKDVRKVLSSRDHVQKGLFYKSFDVPIGTGAFNSPVGIWKERRPHLEKAFHSKVMTRWPKVFDKCSKSLVQILKSEAGDGRTFDVHPYINFCTIQMLVQGAFDVQIDVLGEIKTNPCWQQLVQEYEKGTYACEFRMLRPWLLISDFLWNLTSCAKQLEHTCHWITQHFYKRILENKRKGRNHCVADDEENKYPGFLDLILNLQNSQIEMTEKDIIDEIASLFIAGHDASGKSISFTLLYLGHYPECQKRVIKELDEIFGEDQEREITDKDLSQMKYLECCVKESLRLMPPVSFITRKVGTDVYLDNKAMIPKGTEVAISTYSVHRDEEIYPNPEEFQPERFLPENSKGRDPYAWIPFSAGPRNCLGYKFALMEDKVVLANILRNFSVKSVGQKDNWILNTNVTLKLEGGWNIKLFSRF